MIENFRETRKDGKVIPESMTGEQMIVAGWEPCKVLRLQWDGDGKPVELVSAYGFLSRVVASREYLAVLEDTDETGQHATLSVYEADGTLRKSFSDVLEFAATERWPARTEAGDYAWFRTPQTALPTAFAVVFRVYRNGATYRVEMDAANGEVLGTEEFR